MEIIVRPSSFDGTDWIEIKIDPLNELFQPLLLGQKWVEFVTDEECEELENVIEQYKEQACIFLEKSKRLVKATVKNGKIKLLEVPESIRDDWSGIEKFFDKWVKTDKNVVFIDRERNNFYAFGDFAVDIDGNTYIPHYSYWLQSAYYIADDFIKSNF